MICGWFSVGVRGAFAAGSGVKVVFFSLVVLFDYYFVFIFGWDCGVYLLVG